MPSHTLTFCVPLALLVFPVPLLAQTASSPEGKRLARLLDGMKVEELWKPGIAVHWKSGKPDPEGRQKATHCSAFAASTCAHLGVYLLRPPQHSQTLLANAQAD